MTELRSEPAQGPQCLAQGLAGSRPQVRLGASGGDPGQPGEQLLIASPFLDE